MSVTARWLGGALGIAAAAAVIYFLRAEPPVVALVGLASQGGERVLREPMRPLRGRTRVLIFALDGVGDDEFHDAVRQGAAPHMGNLLGADTGTAGYLHAHAVQGASSILPSTTMAAWSAIYTGEPPARTGVPGNEWFERERRRFVAPAPVSISDREHTVEMLSDGLVGNALQVPTLFELAGVRSFVSLAPVYRGADLFTTPEPSAVVDLFVEAAKGVTGDGSVARETYSEIDLSSVDNLLEAIGKYGVPDLQVVYFPGIDLFTHVASAPLQQEEQYLRSVTDSAVGRVLARYDILGALDDTYVVFVSDHGHTPVLADDRHALGTDGDDEPPAIIARAGFRLRPFVLEPAEDQQDYQATVAYQGAMAYVYLADRSTCPRPGDRCEWTRPPRLDEDVMPVARAFHDVNRTGDPIPALKGTLDLVLAREPAGPGRDARAFEVFDGERLVPIARYLARHPRPDLLRLEERLRGLAVGPYGHRAGDILLLAHSGAQRPIEERFYFSGPHHSWHGSADRQDSEIPLVVARRGSPAATIRSLVEPALSPAPSQLDVVGLVRALLAAPTGTGRPAGNASELPSPSSRPRAQ